MTDNITDRRDELRRLSELRMEAGYPAYPTAENVKATAEAMECSEKEAHDYLMRKGERELETKENES